MSAVVMRALRGLLAVITVWCIGCSSFEPMVERWVSGENRADASCMGDEGGSTSDVGGRSMALKSAPTSSGQIGCGCTDCIAVAPVVLAVLDQSHATPETPLTPLPAFLGIAGEPQVPPPR